MQDGGSEENIDLITESNQANQNASLLPNIFVRDYSIRIEAGKNNFCAFIDLKLMNKLSVFYRVSFYIAACYKNASMCFLDSLYTVIMF